MCFVSAHKFNEILVVDVIVVDVIVKEVFVVVVKNTRKEEHTLALRELVLVFSRRTKHLQNSSTLITNGNTQLMSNNL